MKPILKAMLRLHEYQRALSAITHLPHHPACREYYIIAPTDVTRCTCHVGIAKTALLQGHDQSTVKQPDKPD